MNRSALALALNLCNTLCCATGAGQVFAPDVDIEIRVPERPPSAVPPGAPAKEDPVPQPPANSEDESGPPPAPADPQAIQLNLMDGSVISGKLSVQAITVKTRFGSLQVPIEAIRSFTPGLDSYPALQAEVRALIEGLGSDNSSAREAAGKQLSNRGRAVEAELREHLGDGNAERVRHIKAILAEFQRLAVDADEDESPEKPLPRLDTIVTTDFTVLGRISPQTFQLASAYGPLTIKLSDIRSAQRGVAAKEAVRRSLSVDGQNLAQVAFKDSGIRLERGDKVSIIAGGTIVMTPWGGAAQSTPDGAPNYGWYTRNQIPAGALVAKIGDGGRVFKAGTKHDFTADRSGTLRFAIGMPHQFARGHNRFPGKYDLKVKIEPKRP